MFPALLAASAAPALFKGLAGLFQLGQKVERRDVTPPAFRENLDLTRQLAGARRPGEGLDAERIQQGTAAVNAGALRAGGSSADVLASLAASDAQKNQALAGMSQQGAVYQQQQQGQLRRELDQQAAYQQQNDQNYEREKAALKQGGLENVFGGLDGLSQVAAYGLRKGGAADTDDGTYGVGQRLTFPSGTGTYQRYDLPDAGGYPRRRSPYGAMPAWMG